jgi:hypothetical protein
MTKRSAFEILMSIAIPVSGAMGYVHGNFVTKSELKFVEKNYKVSNDRLVDIHNILCKIAIKQQLTDAVEICNKR